MAGAPGILEGMRIRVLLFGVLREVVAEGEQVLEFSPASTVGSVLAHYREASPGLEAIWSTVAVAVNQQYVQQGAVLRDGDEVALLPPVSGGLDDVAWLTREAIPSERIVAEVKAGSDGAVVVFDGIVRNNTRGRQTLYLDYEAYEAMALEQMRGLVAQVVARFGVRRAVLVHRLGRIEISESSVLIVVASAHRGAAYEASRWLIDTLKTTVPIWKKEYFVDGAVWADGEPFPEAIVPAGKPL